MIDSKKTLLKNIPKKTGIYIMRNTNGKPVYIGKAKDLKSRVGSYFNQGGDNRPQINYLVNEVDMIDFIVTKNEREALILENSLIKSHKPKYNIRLKDDKSYSFLTITKKDKFPKLLRKRRVREDGSLYYGPFASAGALKQTKQLVHKLFQLRDCTDEKFKRHWQRPCLNYNLKLCLGPCAEKVTREKYSEAVMQAESFLSGDKKQLINMLKKDMYRAAEDTNFEEAAYLRDQIKLLSNDLDVQKVLSSNFDDKDIIGVFESKQSFEIIVLFSRFGSIIDKSEFTLNAVYANKEEILQQFLSRFYQDGRYIPKEIILGANLSGKKLYEQWLSEKKGKKVVITRPVKGSKLKLLTLADKNAEESFNKKIVTNKSNADLLKSLKKSISLNSLPATIECFDISNMQGTNPVASMVRFTDALPDRDRYRRYKIKTVDGPDDYASMHEVLERRFKRADEEGWEIPNLIMIDGGKGQLGVVSKVIRKLGYLDKMDLISIAKGRKEGELDKIYVDGIKNPYVLSDNKQGLYLLMRVRDEAHRFAIDYHRKKRGQKFIASGLDNVPGIGRRRRITLLNHFGSLEKIRSATVEEISQLPGMNKKVAVTLKENIN